MKWDQALYTDRMLPAAAKQVMWTPFKSNYAYGWGVPPASAETFGHRRIQHGGGINGFSSMFIRLPDANVTVIVLTNNTSLPGGSTAVARDLLAIYYGQPYNIPAVRTVAKVDPAIYDRYVGKYELTPSFAITVTRDGNSLITQATNQGKIEIFPESETKFFPKVIDATITFEKDAGGKVVALILDQNGKQQRGKKIE